MLYILEGCDGAGKTTVATQLAEILDAEIIHCSQYTPNDFYFFAEIANAAREKNIIADRFCYGQFIYQEEEKDRPLCNRHNGKCSALKSLHELEALMLQIGVKVIQVTATSEVIKDRLALRKENLINGLTVEQVLLKYEAIKNMSILPWITWDTTGGEQ